jgi:serine/threonine protein phosphatase PrpC
MTTLNFAALSDVGNSRVNNEDVWIALPELNFFALADGMGGRKAGEVAAKDTIEELENSAKQLKSLNAESLKQAIERANERVYKKSHSLPEFKGMGTTICCFHSFEGNLYYGHVGDSRLYRLRKGKLTCLTEDHSHYNRWLALGSPGEKPPKHILTKAVGTSKLVEPEMGSSKILIDDLYLLCSDGLTDSLNDEKIQEILLETTPLTDKAKKLVESAKTLGSKDNITVLLVHYNEKNIF